MKKVSIIIPCFNQGKFIKDAIESCIKQTYKNIELIIINDASNDSSEEIIKQYEKEYQNIKYIKNKENKGVVFSRNIGITNGGGDFILPLDADDTIEPTYIEKAVDILENNNQIGIVYCKAKYFGTKTGEWILPEFSETNIYHNNMIFVSALFRKADFIKAGMYKQNMEDSYEDWDLWLTFIEMGLKAYRINEFLFNYRQHNLPCRTKQANEKSYEKLIKNHPKFYIDNDFFVYKKKYKKYKKLYNIFLVLTILELILFLIITIF